MARSTKKPKIDISLPPEPSGTAGGGGWPLHTDHVEDWAWRMNCFTPAECEAIIRLGTKTEMDKASTAGPMQSDKVRNSFVNFMFPNHSTGWIFERMAAIINEMNAGFFGFDLSGMEQGLQFTKYSAPGQHYDWHIDRGRTTGIRKLSVSVQLSDPADFTGGQLELQFGRGPTRPAVAQGTAILFPSYVLHRVTPVKKGTRYSLVAWVSGPPFK